MLIDASKSRSGGKTSVTPSEPGVITVLVHHPPTPVVTPPSWPGEPGEVTGEVGGAIREANATANDGGSLCGFHSGPAPPKKVPVGSNTSEKKLRSKTTASW